MTADDRSPAERLLDRNRDPEDSGRPLSRHARQYQRTLEGYLQAGHRPRWMERLAEIDLETGRERRRLERAHRDLREECGDDAEEFARRWRAVARGWPFDDVNELIRQHNDWYPIERNLPVDPRTRDYVLIHGRSYRREPLGAAWVLAQFPAEG
jgi:hypothetical protein